MEDSELPIGIKKYIEFIEYVKQWDSECKQKAYYDILNKMNSNEEAYEKMSRKNPNIEETLNDICAGIQMHSVAYWLKRQVMFGKTLESGIAPNKTEIKQQYQELANDIEQYYYDLGQLMNETGMIDVLVERNNKAFEKIGAPHFRITNEEAMKEFDIKKHRKTTYNILCMKVVFTINKVIKLINSASYAKMLEKDRFNSNINNDNRIKLLSHLKTTYLKKVTEGLLATEDDKEEQFLNAAQSEYERLFKEEFKQLDFGDDLVFVGTSKGIETFLYADKTAWLTNLIELTVYENNKFIKGIDPDLKDCGLCKDDKGQWVLGMNVYGYPMPITVHVNTDVIEESRKSINVAGMGRHFSVNKYKILKDQNGKVFPSNVLFMANEKARDKAKSAYSEDKTDPIKKYFYSQIISKDHQDKNIERYDEKELR